MFRFRTITMTALHALLITGVSSSYGATVSFAETTAPIDGGDVTILTNVTDTAGISSGFVYSFVAMSNYPTYAWNWQLSQLVTPYGTTSFSPADQAGETIFDRFLEITNAVGDVEFYGMLNEYTNSDWPDYLSGQIPTNTPLGTLDTETGTRQTRNTFYWNAQQFAPLLSTPLTNFSWTEFKTGRIRHWLATTDTYTHFGALSVEQGPSPDGGTNEGQLTWYDYTNKPSGSPGEVGSQIMPSVIARVVPDGSTWFDYFELLTNGLPTEEIEQWVEGGSVLSRTNTFIYAANNIDLLAWTNALGVLASSNVFNANHEVATNYDALGEMTIYTYDPTTFQLTGVSYPSGLVRTNIYNGSHRLAQTIDQPVGATNSYVWNGDGTLFSQTDGRGLTITNFWDGLHRLTGSLYPDGTTTSNSYTLIGGFTYPTSSGSTTIMDTTGTKDRLGNWTYYVWDAVRRKIFETNANDIVTAYGYCPCGSVAFQTNALGTSVQEVTTHNYDYQGNSLTIEYADGYTINNTFDSLRRLTSRTDGWKSNWFNYDNTGLLISVSNLCGIEKETSFDLLDRPVYLTDENGVTITNTYDNLNRLLTRGYPDGGVERSGYSARGRIAYTNQLFFTNFYTYDQSNRKTAETNADGQIIKYGYNAAGDLLTLADGKSQTTTWNYDQYGRVTNKLDQTGVVILTYAYDADSRLTNRWSAAKLNANYSYDNVGNLTNVSYRLSPGASFQYDPLNRLTNMIDSLGTTVFSYTLGNQLLTEVGPFANDAMTNSYIDRLRTGLSLQQPSGLWTNGFGYDAAERLTNIVSPAGSFTNIYTSGVGGASGYCSGLRQRLLEPNGSSNTNNYEVVARLLGTYWRTNSGGLANKHEYLYNLAGQRTNETRIDGTTVAYAYDPIGQLVAATSSDSAEELGYDYDAAWNLNWWTNSGTARAWQVNSLNEVTNAYPEGVLTFDTNGNTLTANGTHNTFAYDAENRLTAWAYYQNGSSSPANGDIEIALAYDGFGRLRQRLEFIWENNSGQLPPPSGPPPTYWVLTNGINYFYDPGTGQPGGWLVIQERSTNGTPTTSYTHGNDLSGTLDGSGGIGGLLARSDQYSSGNWTRHNYYMADALGNITYMLSSAQAMVATYRYDPFGRVISQSGALDSANSYQFSSKMYDSVLAMLYYGYRFYDANLQRWINRDPLGEIGFDALNAPTVQALVPDVRANRYTFLINDPTDKIDLFGLTWQLPQRECDEDDPTCFGHWKKNPPPPPPPPPPSNPQCGPPAGKCEFYYLHCDWGNNRPPNDPGKGWKRNAPCLDCYQKCKSTGSWPFSKCPMGGPNGPRWPGPGQTWRPMWPTPGQY